MGALKRAGRLLAIELHETLTYSLIRTSSSVRIQSFPVGTRTKIGTRRVFTAVFVVRPVLFATNFTFLQNVALVDVNAGFFERTESEPFFASFRP